MARELHTRRVVSAVGGAALGVALLGGAAGLPAASAHSVLLSSDPADGSTPTTAPREVTLTFNEEVNPDFATVTVLDGAKRNHAEGAPKVTGEKVTAAVDTLPVGQYTIGYRVTSADGHVVQGSSHFAVGDAGSASPVAPQNPAGEEQDEQSSSGSSTALWVIGGLVVLLGVAALVLLRRKPRG